MIQMKTKKQSETFDFRSSKSAFTLYAIALGFFFIGFILDAIRYIQDQSWLFLLSNIPVIIAIIINIATKAIKEETSKGFDAISFILIVANLIYSSWDTILYDANADYGIMRLSTLSIAVIVCGGYLLHHSAAYTFTGIFIINYIAGALYSQSQNLIDNIIIVPIVYLGIGVWVAQYANLHAKDTKAIIKQHKDKLKLSRRIEADQRKVNLTISQFIDNHIEDEGNISDNIEALAKLANYNIQDVARKHSKYIQSEESSFVKKLLKEHPKLTASEIKLSYMLAQNLRTKDIANETMRTVESVRVLRTRLRKKLKLKRETNLVSYLMKYN